ncbi:MAG: general secretion pathway protein GspK [Archangium sp.]|nr:general secretion pathway protein GspK [Archangium sp.]
MRARRLARPKASSPRSRKTERGVALLLVLVGIAVLSLVANEVRYNSMVELRLATNQRDELRAHYLARSGIGMSRLMLRFQKQIDQMPIPNFSGMLQGILGSNPALAGLLGGAGGAGGLGALAGALGGGAGGAAGLLGGAGAAGAPGMSTASIQLWRMAKIDCHMLEGMVPEVTEKGGLAPTAKNKKFEFDDENPELGKEMQAKKFGSFTGCFDTVITDEEERINLNKLDGTQLVAVVVVNQLVTTLNDKRYEFLFEKEDANRLKIPANEVIIGMKDWIDEDETGSSLNLTGQGDPFLRGFSDENGGYSNYETRYRAKNARFDSLDEVFLVHGVNDRFMAAFKDKFTVYPDMNARLNINTDDPVMLEIAIRSIVNPIPADPRLADPIFIDTVIKRIRAARLFAMFGMSVVDFANIVASTGLAVNPTILNNPQNQRFIGDKSNTYRIAVTGSAGDVTRTITAIIRLDDGLGRLVYWREE